MVTVIIQHVVKDFSEWKPIFDADEENRANAGIKLLGLYTSVKDPNDVTMMFETADASTVDSFMGDPRLKETMQRAGVISAPVVSVLKKM